MNIYRIKQIMKNVYFIEEKINRDMVCIMTLIVGEEKAALIDTGFGISGDLREMVETITSKPISCYITHGDPDHVGSAAAFDSVYMSTEDENLMRESLMFKRRLANIMLFSGMNLKLVKYAKTHMLQDESFAFEPIVGGDTIDLGGTKLEVIALPAHSKGCLCYYNRADGYAITGDSIGIKASPLINTKHSTSVLSYRNALIRFHDIVDSEALLYCGHSLDPLPHYILEILINGCDEIIRGEISADSPYGVPFYAKPFLALLKVAQSAGQPMIHRTRLPGAEIRYNAKCIK